MNGKFEMTWRKLRTIANLLMVHAQVLEAYTHFALMYTEDHILPVLPIRDLINEEGEPTTAYKLVTGTKPPISHLRFFRMCCAEICHICWDKGVKHV